MQLQREREAPVGRKRNRDSPRGAHQRQQGNGRKRGRIQGFRLEPSTARLTSEPVRRRTFGVGSGLAHPLR